MSSEVIHQKCPYKDCGSSDAFCYNEEKMVGHCKSCDRGYPSKELMFDWAKTEYPVKENGFTPKAIEEVDVFEVFDTPTSKSDGKYVATRGISSNTMEFYGVKLYDKVPWKAQNKQTKLYESGVSDEWQFPYPSGGYKIRRHGLDKEHFAHFSGMGIKSDELFGQNLFAVGSSKMVTVTEGEYDAMAAYQMLSGGGYTNPVVSLPSATPSGKLWEKCKSWLDSFEKIILSADNDKAGQALAERMSLMFPSKVFVMDHGQFKDANDFLINNKSRDFKNAWWAAKKFRPDDVLIDADDYLNLYDESPDFEYFPTGVEQLDEKILGICKGYFTVIQAPTGVGKTEVMRYLEYQCLTTSDYTFAYMHLEESKLRSVLGLVSYQLDDNLTLKKFIEEKGRDAEVRESIKGLTDSERMIQFSYKPEDGYETLLDKIKYLVAAYGVDYVFFEPIQDLVTGTDKEGQLADLSSRLGTMASDIGVGIVTIAHQNQTGETMYATMIGKKAAFEIVLNRDQEAEDLTERNRTYITVGRKNRVGLGNGPAGSFAFDLETYKLKPWTGPAKPVTNNREDIPF